MEEISLALTPPRRFVRSTIQARLPCQSSSLYSMTGYDDRIHCGGGAWSYSGLPARNMTQDGDEGKRSMDAGDLQTPTCFEATRVRDGRLLVTCHVTPRARSERIACEGEKLRVWLHSPPVEGAANEALIELFARALRLPRRAIALERGATARRKTLAIEGLNEQEFWRRLGFTASEQRQ